MNKIMKISAVIVAVMLAGSVTMADPYGCRSGYSSHSGGYDHGRHGGYYHGDYGGLALGLFGVAAIAAVACAVSQPEPVYVQRQVVYAPPPVVYVAQPAQVVYQPAPVQMEYVQQPISMVINVQNSNGSMTPVTLRQIGNQWVGPRGEYYDNLPTIGQLRTIYGF
ncbi:MAG: hypothetical protein WCS52_12965 [bacterium]